MKKIILCTLLLAIASPAVAADCLAIRKKIKQERDLFQKRELTKQGLQDCPNDAVINFTFAYSMERFRKYEEARNYYQTATRLDPKYAKAFFGLGDMHLQLNEPGKAVRAYEKGLKLQPNDKRAQNSLAEAKQAAKKAGVSLAAVPPAKKEPIAKPPSQKAAAVAKKPAAQKKITARTEPMEPYGSKKPVFMQQSLNQLPVIAQPLRGEKLQSIRFKISAKPDNTGLLEDKKILLN